MDFKLNTMMNDTFRKLLDSNSNKSLMAFYKLTAHSRQLGKSEDHKNAVKKALLKKLIEAHQFKKKNVIESFKERVEEERKRIMMRNNSVKNLMRYMEGGLADALKRLREHNRMVAYGELMSNKMTPEDSFKLFGELAKRSMREAYNKLKENQQKEAARSRRNNRFFKKLARA